MSKNRRNGIGSVFDTPTQDAGEWDVGAAYYGELPTVDAGRIVAEAIAIASVTPDPAQPRRVLPSAVRDRTRGSRPQAVIKMWWDMAEHAQGDTIPLHGLVLGEESGADWISDNAPTWQGDPTSRRLIELAGLAADIYTNGLQSPIAAYPAKDGYTLVYGERRWWAHQLIFWLTGSHDKIACQVVEPDLWQQASENATHESLSGIGKARQFARLLMDIYAREHGVVFNAYDACETDQGYYAQVADGTTYKIPYGKSDALRRATGVQHLTRLRSILRVDPALWTLADDENMSIDAIVTYGKPRPTSRQTRDDRHTFSQDNPSLSQSDAVIVSTSDLIAHEQAKRDEAYKEVQSLTEWHKENVADAEFSGQELRRAQERTEQAMRNEELLRDPANHVENWQDVNAAQVRINNWTARFNMASEQLSKINPEGLLIEGVGAHELHDAVDRLLCVALQVNMRLGCFGGDLPGNVGAMCEVLGDVMWDALEDEYHRRATKNNCFRGKQ